MLTRIGRLGLVLLIVGLPLSAAAQSATDAPLPATLSYVEGGVDVDHEGVAESATAPTLLLEGDRVRTRDGRAEIVLADGSLFHVDGDTTVEWLGSGHLRLLRGRVMARLSPSAAPYAIDTPAGAVRLQPRGEYDLRLGVYGSDLQLSVVRGVAELDAPDQRHVVRGGETLAAAASGQVALRRFNSARFDAFTSWAYERASGSSDGESSRHLPAELRAYGSSLDRHGRWDHLDSHGYVWYPSVAVGWRPYSHGGWRHTRYGWTWYGLDAWAWPTHHFGRWGFSGSAWYWVPGQVWGPAWVSWAFAPGYIGWSPLGWDGGFRAASARGWRGRGDYDSWHSWTTIPRHRFGQRGAVQSWMVDRRHLPDASRGGFVYQAAPPPSPAWRGSAVPRGSFSVGNSSPRPTPPPAPQDAPPGAVPRYGSPSGSWIPPDGVPSAPNSWSRPTPGS
ncbi:MAG: FecR family protein, partial [Acidobacteria bacterium]|nr:FecR family protein [Acidobacteriota bacterium]